MAIFVMMASVDAIHNPFHKLIKKLFKKKLLKGAGLVALKPGYHSYGHGYKPVYGQTYQKFVPGKVFYKSKFFG